MAFHSRFTIFSELDQLLSIEAVAAAKRHEQGLPMLIRAITLSEGVEHLLQPHSEQGISCEKFLMAEQVQLDQQLIGCPPIQRGNHMRERAVKRPFAVSNGQMLTQVLAPKQIG